MSDDRQRRGARPGRLSRALQAYVDGTLPDLERARLEGLMAQDPDLRRRMEGMQAEQEAETAVDALAETLPATPAATEPRAAPEGGQTDLAGRRIGHFVVGQLIGRGGMGEVYRGVDSSLQRPVAIKIISGRYADTPWLMNRFVREARVQARMDHPHVAHVYYIGRFEGRLFFAMEYLPGRSLADRIEQLGRIPAEEAIEITLEVADMLASLQRHEVVHRDLKPSNIMFTADGKIKLTDFGLVKAAAPQQGSLTAAGTTVGTPLYISPEAVRGAAVTWRSDMYSLGCTLYHMLFGRPPYDAENALDLATKHVEEEFPVPDELPPDVRPGLVDVVRCMMAKDPRERFPGYPSLMAALRAARPHAESGAAPMLRTMAGGLDCAICLVLTLVLVFAIEGAANLLRVPGEVVNLAWTIGLITATVVYMGLLPASGLGTLMQRVFSLRTNSQREGAEGLRRFWHGMLATPVGTGALVALAYPIPPLWGLLRPWLTGAVLLWHGLDLATAVLSRGHRYLRDRLFGMRVRHGKGAEDAEQDKGGVDDRPPDSPPADPAAP